MKYTNKKNPIAKQLTNSRYRSRVVPDKKQHSKGPRLEDWEDGQTEQDTRTFEDIQPDDED